MVPKVRRAEGLAELKKILGQNLQKYLDWKQISRLDLEKLSGVTRKTIDNIIAGQHSASISTLHKIATCVDLEVWQLLFLHDQDLIHFLETWNKTNESGRKLLKIAMHGARREVGLD